ncbi:acyl-CoA thioesterase [Dokdonella fugitiva]|jgi:enediyne biosynthesis thioesterase|uniref:acyl-CoA thioesterase n=1 Tax=Dokdonella fugitiva TaxID=328517 RepID=UPI0015FA6AED|nr:enediyne biosynthesis thioesterase [Dokdonella fugitiva]
MTQRYVYRTTVTIGDTNLLQNMYFANHFKLTGVARELWVRDHVPEALEAMRQGLILITREATCLYHRDFYLYDPVRVELWVENMRQASADMRFALYHDVTNELHAEAKQTIVFAGPDHKICHIPESFRLASAQFTNAATQ